MFRLKRTLLMTFSFGMSFPDLCCRDDSDIRTRKHIYAWLDVQVCDDAFDFCLDFEHHGLSIDEWDKQVACNDASGRKAWEARNEQTGTYCTRRYQQDGRDEVKVFVPFADLNVRDANGLASEGTGCKCAKN